MSNWTHRICDHCWNAKNPERPAVTLNLSNPRESCCFCGRLTRSGIYIREDSSKLQLCECEE